MDQQQQAQLIAYIQQQLQRGDSEDTIRATLQQYKWNDEVISSMLAEAKSTLQTGTSSQLPQATTAEPVSTASPEVQPSSIGETMDALQNQPDPEVTPADTQAPVIAAAPTQPVGTGKYGVFQSVGEFLSTVKRTPKTFLAMVAIGYGVGLALLAMFALIFMFLVVGGIMRSGGITSFISYLPILIVGFLLMYGLSIVASAFNTAITSLALMDAANGQQRTVGQVLRAGISQLLRMVVGYVVLWVALFGPLLIVAVVGMILTVAGVANGGGAIVIYLLGMAGIVWGLIASLRFPLIPYVALFEPSVRYRQLPARSYQLMKSGGQWFVFKGVLLLMAVSIILSVITESVLSQTVVGPVISSLIFAVISVIANGVLVMLYIRRRMIVG